MKLLSSIVILVILLISNPVKSQKIILINGNILDKNANGIPYASIGLMEENFGTVAFEDGTFTLSIRPEYLSQMLIFSAVGFESKKMKVLELLKRTTVVLTEKVNVLQEIIITPSDYELVDFGSDKKRSSNSFSIAFPNTGTTVAVLYNEKEEPFWIKKIRVSTGRRNLKEYLLRCRIFLVEKQTNYPGMELLNYNLIKKGEKENEIIIFDLPEELFVDHPFYIGFEWVISREHDVLLRKAESKFSIDAFIDKELVDKGLKPVLFKGRKIKYFNSSSQLIEEENIGFEERKKLKVHQKSRPKVIFQTQQNGNKTIYGSYLTGQWTEYHRSAMTSITVLRRKY